LPQLAAHGNIAPLMVRKTAKPKKPPPLTIWLPDDDESRAQRERIVQAIAAAGKRLGYKISSSAWLLKAALAAADEELGGGERSAKT
jgi:hypothetical protein